MRLSADGIGTVNGRLLLGTAESIPPSELVDTTGAGDAFVGAVLYGMCHQSHHSLFFLVSNYCSFNSSRKKPISVRIFKLPMQILLLLHIVFLYKIA